MQLTRLEIKGFKSFADKVTINFDKGITGIVGPNGCGKSNVVDAIRWVLGEQKTRILRSEKMENIIFNGTKNRKPTQLAEVSLTFDNTKNLIPTEYTQVTITRRYFRSGDSEYQLNGVTCRLKDITNLFLDTGIASNTYAIIELRMVDDLLNDKDNSRRTLFEEAAGISKFKIRKKETLKKLADTDADLDRVEDLLFEIDKNLKSLEKQAKQAKRYYELKDEYKNSSIALAQKTIQTHQTVFQKIQDEIQSHSDQKNSLNTQLLEQEAAIEKLKTDLLNKEKLLASRQKSLNEHVNKIRQYESDKKIKNERQKYLQDKIDRLNEQISQDKQSNERASFSLNSLENERILVEKELNHTRDSLKEAEEELTLFKSKTAQIQQEVNELTSTYSSKKEAGYKYEKDLEIKKIQISTLKNELEKNSEDASKHSNDLQGYQSKITELEQEKQERNRQFESLKRKQDELEITKNALTEKIASLKEKVNLNNRVLDSKQNEFNLTKSMVDNLEGFPEAIKYLKKQSNWKNTPLLSDIIGCPEEYRVCIENYLDSYMGYYVVEDSENAVTAIHLLHDSGKGKANFFILNSCNESQHKTTQVTGSVRAKDVLEYEPKYEKLIDYLLGNVHIYEKSKPFVEDDDFVFLEKSGKISYKKISISGGSVGLFEGKKIGRAKNLEKLGVDIKALTQEQEKLNKQLNDQTISLDKLGNEDKRYELDQLRDEIARFNEHYISIKTKQEQFENLIASSTLKNEDISEQIELLLNETAFIEPLLSEALDGLEQLENTLHQRKSELAEHQEDLSVKSNQFNSINVTYHQQDNRLQSIVNEISYKQESFNSSMDRISTNKEELEKTEKELHDLILKTNSNDDELIGMYDEKESIEVGVNEAEKSYYQVRASIEDGEKNNREIQRRKETADLILREWQEKLTETKIALNSVQERLSIEFNLNFDEISQEGNEEYDQKNEAELKELVSRLKNRIDAIGPINPMAMEAYEEIKERFDFITGQKEDLLNAKQSLLSTIDEIDTIAKETFQVAFDAIKANFIRVFRTLFTDQDDCDLYLTDPDNPLESPIDIIAKPKGKRPLTINQLSGGEKTLTATSLLFAIYLLKPAPFCIFDEVDAPLDDANIDKFNQIIREFSGDSQFIIVTHNKRTMASTDIIYGITMIEQGVSKVVPVDLRELA